MDAWLIKRTLDRSRAETSDHMQCSVCGEFYNKRNLSEVFEHMHNGAETTKEYYGRQVESTKRDISETETTA